jgi:type II secretion system protein H
MISADKHQNGFTLIELLVVAVLIGIIGSYVAVSTSASKSSVIQPVLEKIRESFISASRHAILSGLPVGVVIDDTELSFLRYSSQGWTAHGDETLRTIQLPKDWQLVFSAHTRIPELPVETGGTADTQKPAILQPQLLFYPDGATSGGTLEVVTYENDEVVGLEVSVNGRVKLTDGRSDDDS